jgi:DNA adenine methylase
MQPPIRWVGGKRHMIDLIRPLWNQHVANRTAAQSDQGADQPYWSEPFSGGGALAHELGFGDLGFGDRGCDYPWIAINDTNSQLINMYKQIQSNLDEVNYDLQGWQNDYQTYITVRKQYNLEINDLSPIQAARFYYLNRTCFNGLYRVNLSGRYNTAYGDTMYRPSDQTIDPVYAKLYRTWSITNQPALDYLKDNLRPADFLFLDPPYIDTFNNYHHNPFGIQDLVNLVHFLRSVNNPVVLTNSAGPEIVRYLKQHGFKTYTTESRSRINQTSQPSMIELIATLNIEPLTVTSWTA